MNDKAYTALLRDLKRLVSTSLFHSWEVVRAKHQIGQRILREKIGLEYGRGEELVSKLGSDLKCSRGELLRCVQFARRFHDLEKFRESIGNDEPSWHSITNDILPSLEREEKRQELIRLSKDITIPAGTELIHGDFREICIKIEPESVDLIFTDPQYPDIEGYRDLGIAAQRVLKPGAYLCAYTGSYHLPKVLNALGESLEWHMRVNVRHSSGLATTRLRDRAFWLASKDIVMFSKGPGREHEWMMDVFDGEKGDKEIHEWAQSEYEAAYFVEHLTRPGEMVLDPLFGGGTTIRVAQFLKRRVIGVEIDKKRYQVALGSLAPKAR